MIIYGSPEVEGDPFDASVHNEHKPQVKICNWEYPSLTGPLVPTLQLVPIHPFCYWPQLCNRDSDHVQLTPHVTVYIRAIQDGHSLCGSQLVAIVHD